MVCDYQSSTSVTIPPHVSAFISSNSRLHAMLCFLFYFKFPSDVCVLVISVSLDWDMEAIMHHICPNVDGVITDMVTR